MKEWTKIPDFHLLLIRRVEFRVKDRYSTPYLSAVPVGRVGRVLAGCSSEKKGALVTRHKRVETMPNLG